MARRYDWTEGARPREDDDLDDASGEFGPDDLGLPDDDDDLEGTAVPCPHCRQEVHEDASWCRHCANFIAREVAPEGPRPWWLLLGVLACLYAVYHWFARAGH